MFKIDQGRAHRPIRMAFATVAVALMAGCTSLATQPAMTIAQAAPAAPESEVGRYISFLCELPKAERDEAMQTVNQDALPHHVIVHCGPSSRK